MIGVKWSNVPRWVKLLSLVVAGPWWLFWLTGMQLFRCFMVACFFLATWDGQMAKYLWRDTQ